MITNETEYYDVYYSMTKEQKKILNDNPGDLNYQNWSDKLDEINCPTSHEFEYRYHYSDGGVLQLFNQCTSCGKRADKGGSLKHSTIDNFKEKVIRGEINKFDDDLYKNKSSVYENYNKYLGLKYYKKQQEREEEREHDKTEWFKKHNEYLLTDQWKAIRLKVLKRDNFLCQGCLEAPATEVHHLDYAHWKNELMFELLSVCSNCHHNRIHIK
jgi:hypothetical protein